MLDFSALQNLTPITVADPLDRMTKLVALQNAKLQGQRDDLANQQAQKKLADPEKIQQAIQDATDPTTGEVDWDKASAGVMHTDATLGQNLAIHAENIRNMKAQETERIAQGKRADAAAANANLTPEEKNFQAFYKPYLDSQQLQPNAANELNARRAFKLQGTKVTPGESVLGDNGQPVYTAPVKAPVPTDEFQATYLPAYLRAHGVTDTTPQPQRDQVTLQANQDYKKIAQDPAMQELLRSNAANSQLEKSFASSDNQLKTLRTPIDAQAKNISDAKDYLAQNNPSANALVAPAIIKALVGGQGSGVRITTPEISAINNGRGKIADFRSWLSAWSADPKAYEALLPEQKQWLGAVLDKINSKVQSKQSAISTANQSLIDATDTRSHKQILKDLNDSLEGIDSGSSSAGTANPQLKSMSTDDLFKALAK